MRLIRHIDQKCLFADGCVLTIGNFDGVHLGHQTVLANLKKQSQKLALPMVVLCFEPQPLEYFKGDGAPARLFTARDKLTELAKLGVDALILLRFDQQMANKSADDFIAMLVDQFNVKSVIIGDDFHFGKGRGGDFSFLCRAGEKYGFSVLNAASFTVTKLRVSSTLIRHMLEKGDVSAMPDFLGRSFNMSGRVMHGNKLGREIGFPTANIHVKNRKTPLRGVFAVTIKPADGLVYEGVANIGTRPTVEATSKVLLEAHLFDFNGDLYGQRVTVSFLQKIRDEKKFSSLEQLTQQITNDKLQAQAFFTKNIIAKV